MKPARLSQARIFAAIDPDQPDEQYPAMRGRNHPDRIDLRIPAKPLLRRRLFSKAHFAFIFSECTLFILCVDSTKPYNQIMAIGIITSSSLLPGFCLFLSLTFREEPEIMQLVPSAFFIVAIGRGFVI